MASAGEPPPRAVATTSVDRGRREDTYRATWAAPAATMRREGPRRKPRLPPTTLCEPLRRGGNSLARRRVTAAASQEVRQARRRRSVGGRRGSLLGTSPSSNLPKLATNEHCWYAIARIWVQCAHFCLNNLCLCSSSGVLALICVGLACFDMHQRRPSGTQAAPDRSMKDARAAPQQRERGAGAAHKCNGSE